MPVRAALAATALALVALAAPARAGTAIALGADWLTEPSAGLLELTLAADRPQARGLTLGGRIGALVGTDGIGPGVPIDLRLRFRADRIYVDGLVGPWVFFDDGDAVRVHAAIGFGLVQRGGLQVGLEVGYLDPTASVGLRLAWPF
jgi:hypothetical protein